MSPSPHRPLRHSPGALRPWRRTLALGLAAVLGPGLGGCAVIAVADVAASAVVGTAGLAVDAAVGTAKIAGKVVGKTADVVLGSDDKP